MKINHSVSKIICANVLLILLFSTQVGVLASSDIATEKMSDLYKSPLQPIGYTHTVLVEGCTASWCGPCATAAAQMKNIYDSGDYDFYYVALVSDKNTYAHQRCVELGVQYIPDYVFDGDYTRWVGSSGLPSAYTSRLESCGARDVADIDLELDITWNGGAEMDINLDIANNEGTAYNGHLHVYVTEIESRWNTNSGQPYHFAMIGNYAFNQNINIAAGDTSHHSTTWDGETYGFNDLDKDNIMIIATVFNSDNNNYVDETTATTFGDQPPIEIDIKSGITKISANIKNIGDEDLTNVNWDISVTGGILKQINISIDGTIDTLVSNDEVKVNTDGIIFGLGKVDIIVTVETAVEVANGIVLGPFILVI